MPGYHDIDVTIRIRLPEPGMEPDADEITDDLYDALVRPNSATKSALQTGKVIDILSVSV